MENTNKITEKQLEIIVNAYALTLIEVTFKCNTALVYIIVICKDVDMNQYNQLMNDFLLFLLL